MSRRSPETFMKRQRELRKREKAARKLEKKLSRRQTVEGAPEEVPTEGAELELPPPEANPWADPVS